MKTMHEINDSRIAQINVSDISKIKISSDGFILPIIDHSGLRININVSAEQANFLVAYLQIAICAQFVSQGPQLSNIPKAPIVVDVHEWSIGLKESSKNIIARFKNEKGEMFDFDLDCSVAARISNDINGLIGNYS